MNNLISYRRTPSEESVKNCACSVINYVIDTLNISPKHIILYIVEWKCDVDMAILLEVRLVYFYLFLFQNQGIMVQLGLFFRFSVFIIIDFRVVSCRYIVLFLIFDSVLRRINMKQSILQIHSCFNKQIKDIGSPVTFIHGTDDIVVPLSHPKRLFSLVPSHLRFRCLFVVREYIVE